MWEEKAEAGVTLRNHGKKGREGKMRQMEKGEKETGGSNGETRERRRIEAGTQEDWIVGSRQSVLAECRSQSRTSCRLNHVIQQAACCGEMEDPQHIEKNSNSFKGRLSITTQLRSSGPFSWWCLYMTNMILVGRGSLLLTHPCGLTFLSYSQYEIGPITGDATKLPTRGGL